MRLDEIIQTSQLRVAAKKAITKVGSHSYYLKNLIGNGSFANVYQAKDAHLVNKRSIEPVLLEKDPYYIYINDIVKNNLASENPYYPRIYSIVLIDSPEIGAKGEDAWQPKGTYYHVNMESLLDYEQVGIDELGALVQRITDFDTYSGWFNTDLTKPGSAMLVLMGVIEYALKVNEMEHAKDPLFEDALRLIRSIKSMNEEFAFDIRETNIMFRRTSVGLQLVLTDLLFNREML
jgi:hypothetical protein